MFKKKTQNEFAGIEYHGLPGITSHCLDAIVRLIHFGDIIERVSLLTCDDRHGFIVHLECDRPVAIKTGFSSGYSGAGPRGLSKALLLVERHCSEIDEYVVSEEFLDRLDNSCLRQEDLHRLGELRPVRPTRYYDYIFDQDWPDSENSLDELVVSFESCQSGFRSRRSLADQILNDLFPREVPFGIIDDRMVDLAFKFKDDPDGAILTGYKRLEGIIRDRIGGSDKSGTKLIGDAFSKGERCLCWPGVHDTEQRGRAQIFAGAFMAFRNRRAHSEIKLSEREELREFLLVNELFLLEREADMVSRESGTSPSPDD